MVCEVILSYHLYRALSNISIADARVLNATSSPSVSPIELGLAIDQPSETTFDVPMTTSFADTPIPRTITFMSHGASVSNRTTAYSPAPKIAAINQESLNPKNAAASTGFYKADCPGRSKYKTRHIVETVIKVVTVYIIQSTSLQKDVGSGEHYESVVSTGPAGSNIGPIMLSGGSAKNGTGTKPSHPTRYTPGPEVSHNSKETVTQVTRTSSSSDHNLANDTILRIACTGSSRDLPADAIIDLTCYSGSLAAPPNDTSPCHGPTNSSNPTGSKPDDDAAGSPKDPKTTMERISDAVAVMYAVSKSIYHLIDSIGALRKVYDTVMEVIDRYGGVAVALWVLYRRF